jgi:hypothetical protein
VVHELNDMIKKFYCNIDDDDGRLTTRRLIRRGREDSTTFPYTIKFLSNVFLCPFCLCEGKTFATATSES